MKRILLSLGCTLALGPGLVAQDAAPAARLGRPAASLGRPVPPTVRGQEPDVTSAAGLIPQVMPKTSAAGTPGSTMPAPLPMPSPAPIPGGPIVTIPPGGTVGSGPILMGPGSTFATSPFPTGPIVADPMGGCATGSPCPTNACGWYTSAEALFWYVKSYSTPPLISVGPAFSGATLGTPGTFVPAGATAVDSNPRYGARATLGYWFTPEWAAEITGFYIRPASDTFFVSSTQYPDRDLARPFLSANTGLESSEIVGRPGIVSGYIRRHADSTFWGIEANLRHRWWSDCNNRLDLIAGYRHVRLEESLKIEEQSVGLPQSGAIAGIERFLTDEFTTKNRFHGFQVGAIFEHTEGPWTFALTTKVAFGITRQSSEVRGSIVPVSGGAAPDLPGGLLALNSNIGVHSTTKIAVVPEVGLNIGYDVSDRMRIFAGYTFMYWSDVIRPGAQIDRVLDVNRIPDFPAAPPIAGVRPTPSKTSENLWAQGVNFGILWKW
jgi:hypothetical protein